MKRFRLALIVFLALLVPTEAIILLTARSRRSDVVAVNNAVTSAKVPATTVDSGDVDRFVQESMRRSGIPGVALAIIKGDQVLHTAGYGRNADGSPVTADTVMAIASLSKSFTAMAVMQLVAEGAISLDAPVRRYVDEFRPIDARAARITVRQLLNHSSGLTFESLPGAMVRGRPPLHRSLEQRVAWLSGAILRTEPGTKTTYDNFGYQMLARLVERVGGKPYADYLRTAVFTPLGMGSTRSFLTTRDEVTVPTGHMMMFGFPVQWQMPADLVAGAGGIGSSANDLARWLAFQASNGRTVNGNQLLPPAMMASMHAASDPASDYGFGWRQGRLADGTIYYHHSGRIVSYAAHQALYPTTGIAYAFVTNGLDPIPAGPAALIAGLNAIAIGRSPAAAGYGSAVIDHLVVLGTILVLSIGIVGVVGSGQWAMRHSNASLFGAAVRCLPYAGIAVAAVCIRLVTVPWNVWWETWPPFAIAYPVAAGAATALVLSRAARLASIRRRRGGTWPALSRNGGEPALSEVVNGKRS